MIPVSLEAIRAAQERVAEVVLRTPLQPFLGDDVPDGNRLWFKAENLQRTASFKIRGAYNAVAGLDDQERDRGVIAYSSGNHGQAVAYSARVLGTPAVIVMPEDAIPAKVGATRRWGAEIVFAGYTSLDRQARALELAEVRGYTVIPPFDDPRIIAGQGTIGLEIIEQLPELEAVVVQVGGGGLISGIATAVKELRPDVRIIGVEPEGAADAKESLESGNLVTWSRTDTVADGLRGSRIGELNFTTIRETVDRIVTVSEDEILRAVGILAYEAKLIVEPSGAVAPAAVLFGHSGPRDSQVVAIVSGGNIDPARLQACLERVPQRTSTLAST